MSANLTLQRARVDIFNANLKMGAPSIKPVLSTAEENFKRTYRLKPASFVHDCFIWKDDDSPTAYQNELLEQLPIKKRISVRGPHGLGKTAIASWFILWFALTRDGDDWKCPTTASAWRQLTKFLWPEIHKWSRKLNWAKIGRKPFDSTREMLQLNLKLKTGEAFALASDNHTSLEGAHADSLLYVFDEAKAVPDETFDAAEGAFMGSTASEAYALAISTPGEPIGRFFDIHTRKPGLEDWWVRHVTLKEAIAAGRIDVEKAEQRKRQWGAESALYKNRVEGEFCASDEEGVIPLAWVELANERWRQWNENGKELGSFKQVGVDVGEGKAKDNTCYAMRYDTTTKIDEEDVPIKLISEIRKNNNEDTMQTAGRVVGILTAHGGKATVDVIGIGSGVVSRVREQGFDVVGFNASEASPARDMSGEMGFANKRTAAWWNLREMLDPANGHNVALPPSDILTGDLTTPHKKPESGGRLRMESKDDFKKRLGRSTDEGDAVVEAFYEEAESNTFIWAA